LPPATLSALEPLAGAGVAIGLAYLALERFRYRRDVEAEATKLHEKYEKDSKLNAELGLEQLNELRWFCRTSCNGYSPKGWQATVYSVFFRSHGDVFIIAGLTAMSAAIMVVGVAGAAEIMPQVTSRFMINVGFIVCMLAMAVPGVSVLTGRRNRFWAMARARECDHQVVIALQLSAREAEAPEAPIAVE
jgi:hypothetical protein